MREAVELVAPADAAINALGAAALHLFTSYGDQRDAARQSLVEALARSGLAAHDINAPLISRSARQTATRRRHVESPSHTPIMNRRVALLPSDGRAFATQKCPLGSEHART